MKKFLIFITIVVLIVFNLSSFALAGSNLVNYWVVAYNNSTLGKSATGTHGHNYVMANPTVNLQITLVKNLQDILVAKTGSFSPFCKLF